MEDPNLILTLVAVDPWKLAEKAFCLPHNSSRYVAPLPTASRQSSVLSRETTPLAQQQDEAIPDASMHRLQLTFNEKPKNIGRGFVFGTDPLTCDVLLGGRRRQNGLSGTHFRITFDTEKRVVLIDSSTNGTTVSYDGQGKNKLRHYFTWILFEKYETITVEIKQLAFEIRLARYEASAELYKTNVKKFLEESRPWDPDVENLGLGNGDDPTARASALLSPTRRAIYLLDKKIGNGEFGSVYKVIDVSTGLEYAGKKFHRGGWKREGDIMEQAKHARVVEFKELTDEVQPLLVMEYMPLGNLQQQHRSSPILIEESVVVLDQGLRALEYLHSKDITHRDIKPENILVHSRNPLSIKFADFGLAKANSDLRTFCGTPCYAAPEIFDDEHYTSAVDLWSLGVVIFRFAYGLPRRDRQSNKGWGKIWCRRIIDVVSDWDSELLIDFLATWMLKWKPQERLSAGACLRKGRAIGLFNGPTLEAVNITPRPRPLLSNDEGDTDKLSTIILGQLWSPKSVSVRRDKDKSNVHRNESLSATRSTTTIPRMLRSQRLTALDSSGNDSPVQRFSKRQRTAGHQPWKAASNAIAQSVSRADASAGIPALSLLHGAQERSESRSPVHRRSVSHADRPATYSAKQFGMSQPPQAVFKPGQKESLNSTLHRGAETIDLLSELPEITSPLERRGDFVAQSAKGHHLVLRLSDAKVNCTKDRSSTGPWTDIYTARMVYKKVNMLEDFRPFFAFGEARLAQILTDPQVFHLQKQPVSAYTSIIVNKIHIHVRQRDSWINATQVLRTGKHRGKAFVWKDQNFPHDVVPGKGVFVPVEVAIRLCDNLGLVDTGEYLREKFQIRSAKAEILIRQPVQHQNFHWVKCSGHNIAIRKCDLKVNLTQCFRAAHKERGALMKYRGENLEIVRGDASVQGSYADFSLAVTICESNGFNLVVEVLLKFKLTISCEGQREAQQGGQRSTEDSPHLIAQVDLSSSSDDHGDPDLSPMGNDRFLQSPPPSPTFTSHIHVSQRSSFDSNSQSDSSCYPCTRSPSMNGSDPGISSENGVERGSNQQSLADASSRKSLASIESQPKVPSARGGSLATEANPAQMAIISGEGQSGWIVPA